MTEKYEELHLKYRPQVFDQMLGQDALVESLKNLKNTGRVPHSMIFHGESGTGKTTISRIIARELGCETSNIIEIDAATYTGVDDMRKLSTSVKYRSIAGISPIKFVILDECFSEDTQVRTKEGCSKIKDIKVGTMVYNINKLVRVKHVFKNKVNLDRVLNVKFSDGTSIYCSEDHLFFTEQGWVEAKFLNGFTDCFKMKKGGVDEIQREKEVKENKQIKRVRVEGIEVYKQGDNDKSFSGIIGDQERNQGYVYFYDLEIDGHPSYYANDVLVHNCHRLSKNAFDSILKLIEEPPSHVYFALCTTEFNKVPKTIKTRCHDYRLKPLRRDDIFELLLFVAEEEKIGLDENMLEVISKESKGSPRQALVMLSKCRECTNIKQVRELLESIDRENDVYTLCQALNNRLTTWNQISKILKSLKESNPESVRIQIVNYYSSCVLNAKNEDSAIRFLEILQNFSQPTSNQTGLAEITLAVGSTFFSENK